MNIPMSSRKMDSVSSHSKRTQHEHVSISKSGSKDRYQQINSNIVATMSNNSFERKGNIIYKSHQKRLSSMKWHEKGQDNNQATSRNVTQQNFNKTHNHHLPPGSEVFYKQNKSFEMNN